MVAKLEDDYRNISHIKDKPVIIEDFGQEGIDIKYFPKDQFDYE